MRISWTVGQTNWKCCYVAAFEGKFMLLFLTPKSTPTDDRFAEPSIIGYRAPHVCCGRRRMLVDQTESSAAAEKTRDATCRLKFLQNQLNMTVGNEYQWPCRNEHRLRQWRSSVINDLWRPSTTSRRDENALDDIECTVWSNAWRNTFLFEGLTPPPIITRCR